MPQVTLIPKCQCCCCCKICGWCVPHRMNAILNISFPVCDLAVYSITCNTIAEVSGTVFPAWKGATGYSSQYYDPDGNLVDNQTCGCAGLFDMIGKPCKPGPFQTGGNWRQIYASCLNPVQPEQKIAFTGPADCTQTIYPFPVPCNQYSATDSNNVVLAFRCPCTPGQTSVGNVVSSLDMLLQLGGGAFPGAGCCWGSVANPSGWQISSFAPFNNPGATVTASPPVCAKSGFVSQRWDFSTTTGISGNVILFS